MPAMEPRIVVLAARMELLVLGVLGARCACGRGGPCACACACGWGDLWDQRLIGGIRVRAVEKS